MSGSERYLTPETETALGRFRDQQNPRVLLEGPVLEILFVAGATSRDVRHGLDTTPNGFIITAQQGGTVQCSAMATWTPDLAFLIASAANTRVRGYFVLTEEPIDA